MKHNFKGILSFLLIILFFIVGVNTWSWGAGYPERPITLIVPFPPGGGVDLAARVIAIFLEEDLKQTIVVENKAGGMNMIGGNLVAMAKPDGYTLGYLNNSATMPEAYAYFQKPPYTSKDLTPICLVANTPGGLIIKGDSPWKTAKDFVEYTRKNPGVKIGTRGPGSIPSLQVITISKVEGVKFIEVPFPGDGPIITAVLGGHILAGFVTYSAARPQLEAGNLRVLLSQTEKRIEGLPDVPCAKEIGYEPPACPFQCICGPRDLPKEIIEKIDKSIQKIVENPRFKERMKPLGVQITYEDAESTKKSLKKSLIEIEKFYKEQGIWKD